MDFIGVTRTIDQAVYMALNALAIVLWRIDSAIIGMSLYSYATQDWLTGNGGGVWYIMDWLLDTSGLFGLNTWTLFAGLALMLWGLSRIARPFIPSSPVHPGKLLFFFVISYVVISQGSALMQDIESWRLDAGSAIYEGVASGGNPDISVPSVPSTSDPLVAPSDLDGQSPIRGWEAVATSYFLAGSVDDIHQPYPPEAFRVAYCLYNPDQPIEDQSIENAQGCSPRNAWDEWDVGDLSILQDVLGIDVDQIESAFEDFLAVLLGDIDLDLTSPVPVTVHHPENRELGIRQAQAGVARLALGTIVALFPIVEANISLMLALAASFIYLTLPIVLLFGFFLATEPMVNRLLMQFVNVIIRTLIISGIVALFMLLLMNTALSGSLTAYLGLVGVGLVGGIFLARVAAATMKETLGQSLGALGAIWMGSATGLLGNSAAKPARATMGLAKMGAAAALLGAGGAMSAFDLAETSYEGVRSGGKDLRQGAPGTMRAVDRQVSRLPAPLSRLAQTGMGQSLSSAMSTGNAVNEGDSRNGSTATTLATTLAAPLAVGALAAPFGLGSASEDQVNDDENQDYRLDSNGFYPKRWTGAAVPSLTSLAVAQNLADDNGQHTRQRRQAAVNRWVDQMYQAKQAQRGQKQASAKGRDLLGEDLAWKVERAVGRHRPAEIKTVLDTARQVAGEHRRNELVRNGRLTRQAITAVRDKLDVETAQAYSGQKGMWDLAALTALTLQQQATASPEEFRRAMAAAESGWGKDSPGHKVPRALRLDPVAAGAHYTAINRFARLSEEAGLSVEQRDRLLVEAQTGQISDDLRTEIETSLQKQREKGQGLGVTTATIVASALAMPTTISGPEQVWTTPEKSRQSYSTGPEDKSSDKAEAKQQDKQNRPAPERIKAQSSSDESIHTPAGRAEPLASHGMMPVVDGAATELPVADKVNLGRQLKASLEDDAAIQSETTSGHSVNSSASDQSPTPKVSSQTGPISVSIDSARSSGVQPTVEASDAPASRVEGPGSHTLQPSVTNSPTTEQMPDHDNLGHTLKSALEDQESVKVANQPTQAGPPQSATTPAPVSQPHPPTVTRPSSSLPINKPGNEPSSTKVPSDKPSTSATRVPPVSPLANQPANMPVGRAEPPAGPPRPAIANTPVTSRPGNPPANPPAGENTPDASSPGTSTSSPADQMPKSARRKQKSRRRTGDTS